MMDQGSFTDEMMMWMQIQRGGDGSAWEIWLVS